MFFPTMATIILGAALLLLILFFYFVPLGLWITALFSGVHVGIGTLIGMRLRKVSPAAIVRPLISATKAGLELHVGEMEAHHLAGGDVGRVVTALISADRANIELPWRRATAIDLAGRDVLEAVQVSVNPITRREWASSSPAKYSQPSRIGTTARSEYLGSILDDSAGKSYGETPEKYQTRCST